MNDKAKTLLAQLDADNPDMRQITIGGYPVLIVKNVHFGVRRFIASAKPFGRVMYATGSKPSETVMKLRRLLIGARHYETARAIQEALN